MDGDNDGTMVTAKLRMKQKLDIMASLRYHKYKHEERLYTSTITHNSCASGSI